MRGKESNDDSAVVRIFDVINNESYPDIEYNGIVDDIRFQRKMASANRRESRRYIRPIFKEPAITISDDEEQFSGVIPLDWRKAIESLPNIIKHLSWQSEIDDHFNNNVEGGSFQPSRPEVYRSRLEYIVGNAMERHRFNNVDNPATIRSRFLQQFHEEFTSANCRKESRIATMNDIDVLETKKLRPKESGAELNLLRKEINKIATTSFLDRRDADGNRRSRIRYYENVSEDREGCEGCLSHGCVGVELKDLIRDVISGKEKWKCVSS